MKAFWVLKAMVLGVVAWVATPAYGYQMTHDYYNRFRSPYKNNIYLAQQAHMARGDLGTTAGSAERFDGYGLQLSAGLEHFRFIQTGAFFSSTNLSATEGSGNEARMVDTGGEAKMVMSTPVSNIVVGGAAVVSRAHLNIGGERLVVSGTGFRGTFEISYYASSQVALVFGASHTMSNYSGKNSKGETVKPTARTSRVGAGLTVWL